MRQTCTIKNTTFVYDDEVKIGKLVKRVNVDNILDFNEVQDLGEIMYLDTALERNKNVGLLFAITVLILIFIDRFFGLTFKYSFFIFPLFIIGLMIVLFISDGNKAIYWQEAADKLDLIEELARIKCKEDDILNFSIEKDAYKNENKCIITTNTGIWRNDYLNEQISKLNFKQPCTLDSKIVVDFISKEIKLTSNTSF